MQEINFFKDPCPHLIIDEFLQPGLAKDCLEEAIKLEAFYEDARIEGHDHLKDDCEDCKKQSDFFSKADRNNKVLYLDIMYKNKRNKCKIIHALEDTINRAEMRHVIRKLPNLFPIFDNVNSSEMILSAYGQCDFYGWHSDTIPKNPGGRIITCVYYMNLEPAKFTGGELVISGKDVNDKKILEPIHNRAVLFESKRVHKVNNVRMDADFKHSRFSINYWVGFNNFHRFGEK